MSLYGFLSTDEKTHCIILIINKRNFCPIRFLDRTFDLGSPLHINRLDRSRLNVLSLSSTSLSLLITSRWPEH